VADAKESFFKLYDASKWSPLDLAV
jgi:hypothetical protein